MLFNSYIGSGVQTGMFFLIRQANMTETHTQRMSKTFLYCHFFDHFRMGFTHKKWSKKGSRKTWRDLFCPDFAEMLFPEYWFKILNWSSLLPPTLNVSSTLKCVYIPKLKNKINLHLSLCFHKVTLWFYSEMAPPWINSVPQSVSLASIFGLMNWTKDSLMRLWEDIFIFKS